MYQSKNGRLYLDYLYYVQVPIANCGLLNPNFGSKVAPLVVKKMSQVLTPNSYFPHVCIYPTFSLSFEISFETTFGQLEETLLFENSFIFERVAKILFSNI